MDFKFGRAAACVALAAMVAGVAVAHEGMAAAPNTPAAQAAVARHQNYKQVGGAFKAISDEIRKGDPDKTVILANATKLNSLAGQAPTWFPKGSGAESGAKTAAKSEIWSDPQGFAAVMKRFQTESGKLQQISAGGDISAIKAQFQATGGACKGCHDKYRVPEKN
jgi:cytochrome c556